MDFSRFSSVSDPYNYLLITVDFDRDIGINTERYAPDGDEIFHFYLPKLRTLAGGGKYARGFFGSALHGAVYDLHAHIQADTLVKPKKNALRGEDVTIISLPSDDSAQALAFDILQSGNMIGIESVERKNPQKIAPIWLGEQDTNSVLHNLWLEVEKTFACFHDTNALVTRKIIPFAQFNLFQPK